MGQIPGPQHLKEDESSVEAKVPIRYGRRLELSHQPQEHEVKTDEARQGELRTLIGGAPDLLRNLGLNIQMLACIHWLAEFQVLACIPPDESVSMADLSALAGISETHLSRVIRFTTTRDFLQEPEPGHVAHTALSAQFAADSSLLDAAAFLAETAAPTALRMKANTECFGAAVSPAEAALDPRLDTPADAFARLCGGYPKVSRQWSAFLRHTAALSCPEEDLMHALSQLGWSNLGDACVVEVLAESDFKHLGFPPARIAPILAQRFPNLRVTVQIITNHKPQPPSPVFADITSVFHDPTTKHEDTQAPLSADSLLVSDLTATTSPIHHPTTQSPPPTSNHNHNHNNHSNRVCTTSRTTGSPQPVTDAAAYIVHLGFPIPASPTSTAAADACRAQLHEYLTVLRASRGVLLVLTTHVPPEPGSLRDADAEAVARARDLGMWQLVGAGGIEMGELVGMIEELGDGEGKLVVVNRLCGRDGRVVVLVVKYQSDTCRAVAVGGDGRSVVGDWQLGV